MNCYTHNYISQKDTAQQYETARRKIPKLSRGDIPQTFKNAYN